MNNTFIALLVKFAMTFAAAYLIFNTWGNNSIGFVFFLALVGTTLNYLLGDLVVLPMFGNVVAAVGDGGLAAITAWAYSLLTAFNTTLWGLVLFGILVAAAEYFFHIYLRRDNKVAP